MALPSLTLSELAELAGRFRRGSIQPFAVRGSAVAGDLLTTDSSGNAVWQTPGSTSIPPATASTLGAVQMSLAPVTAGTPIAVGDNDARMTNARTPTAHTHPLSDLLQSGAANYQVVRWDTTSGAYVPRLLDSNSFLAAAIDGTAGTASLRTLGTGAAQAVAGNDARIPTQPENDALVGTSGAPSSSNKYVTDADARNTNDRTASGLRTATTVVAVSAAAAPVTGQVLTATGTAAATWQAPASGSDPGSPVGLVMAWPTATPPAGYLLCDGSAVSRTTYADLFAAIATTYGAGNGSTTFNVPDYRGRSPIGYDATQTEFNALGKTGGEKSHQLSVAEMPAHSHTAQATGITVAGGASLLPVSGGVSGSNIGIENTGGGGFHNTLSPYLAMHFVIKYQTGSTTVQDASDTTKGVTKLSAAPAVATNPIAVGDNDSRMTNARTPTAHAASHASGGSDPVTVAESQVTNLVTDLAAKASITYADAQDALAIPKSLVDAKGDLLVGTADNTVARRAVGVDGTVLTAASAQPDGVTWAAAGAPGAHASTHAPGGSDDVSAYYATKDTVENLIESAIDDHDSDVRHRGVPIGGIIDYYGTIEPDGWLFPTGQAIPARYAAAIAIIGANTPDLRGRVAVALDNMGGSDAGRLAAANTKGGVGGAETVQLSVAEMPAHTHTSQATQITVTGGPTNYPNPGSPGGVNIGLENTGGGGFHNNMQPYMLVNKLIRVG